MGLEITAGPTNTVVIDRQRMYWMAGKVCAGFMHPSSCARLMVSRSGRTLGMVSTAANIATDPMRTKRMQVPLDSHTPLHDTFKK